MVANFFVNETYTSAEKFLAEKIIELVYNKTLDSHRAKLNNPKWILFEIKLVLKDWHAKKIKNFDKTIRPVILEAIQLIQDDETLLFCQVEKKYYHHLLGVASDKDYLHLYHATNLILEANKNYLLRLYDQIETELMKVNAEFSFDISKLGRLNILTDYLATELISVCP